MTVVEVMRQYDLWIGPGLIYDSRVAGPSHSNICNVAACMSIRGQYFTDVARQIHVEQKFHGYAAWRIGTTLSSIAEAA